MMNDKQKKKKTIKLTPKEKTYADALILTKNKTQAARIAYPEATYGSQRMIGVDNMTKPNIIEYIKQCAPEAFQTVLEIMNKEKAPDAVRLNAAKDILDR
jgi:phage terminase small subunit